MFTCRWCGATYEETESIDHTKDGFWCDMCDCFTFFDPKEYDHRRLLLLLEDKQTRDCPTSHPSVKLRKQLSPLRYPGGKSKLIDYLYARLCKEQQDTFVEVFAGGASLGLSLLDAGVIGRLILNEKDPAVYAFWKTVLNCPQELASRLHSDFPTHLDLAFAKETLASCGHSEPELAWAFLLANRLSFSGIVMAGAQGGKNGSQTALLSRWNPKALEKRIMHIYSMRDKIELRNEDAMEFLRNEAWWGKEGEEWTLFVDPPYTVGQKLYPYYFTEQDHIDLADTLQGLYRECPDPDIIITYDNHPFIRDLYPYAQQEVIPRHYSICSALK